MQKNVAKTLDEAHRENTSILNYNDENSLSAVISYAYMYARTSYLVIREMPSGNGYADIVYIPTKKNLPALVIELKYNQSVDTALKQIKRKHYLDCLNEYQGDILLVGINYSKKNKKHECKIERIKK